MAEEWKDVKDFEGIYQVSNLGRVKSLDRVVTYEDGRKRFYKGKILRPDETKNGYLHVVLCKDGSQHSVNVHRLVALAFIPNPNNYKEVNHIDEDKTNNCVNNLEWCTRTYNNNYGTRTQRTQKKVYQYDLETKELLKVFPSLTDVTKQLGYDFRNISSCCLGKRKQAYNYIWRYDNSKVEC